jgi:Mg2+ and Co2+ transporter CorA
MITLKDKIRAAINYVREQKEGRPEIDTVWFDFDNCGLKDLREIAKEYGQELEFLEKESKMRLLLNPNHSVIIFLRSPKMKVTTHVVVEDVVKNV